MRPGEKGRARTGKGKPVKIPALGKSARPRAGADATRALELLPLPSPHKKGEGGKEGRAHAAKRRQRLRSPLPSLAGPDESCLFSLTRSRPDRGAGGRTTNSPPACGIPSRRGARGPGAKGTCAHGRCSARRRDALKKRGPESAAVPSKRSAADEHRPKPYRSPHLVSSFRRA